MNILIGTYMLVLIILYIGFAFMIESSSQFSKIFTKYDIENNDLVSKSNEELVSIFAKDIIKRNIEVGGEIKWGREKLLGRDIYGKYLMYIEFESQNAFGAFMNNSVIVCVIINEDKKGYSYRKKFPYEPISKVDNLNDFVVPTSYKRSFKWDKEILFLYDYKTKYSIRNFPNWFKEHLKNMKNNIINIIEIIKTNRKADVILGIIVLIIGARVVSNLKVIEVPNLVGMSVSEAYNYIDGKHLRLDVDYLSDSSEIIDSQYPVSGKVKKNSIISVKTRPKYGSSRYEASIYGENVVKAYYSKYGGLTFDGVGKIISITKSEFLEKDNYGRYAFKVSFKYNPINGQGSIMTDRENTKTVIAIYLLNLDNPSGLYVGVQNVITTTSNWEQAKTFNDLCAGDWDTPITMNFID